MLEEGSGAQPQLKFVLNMLLRVWKQDVFENYYGSVLSSQFYGKLGLNLMLVCLEGESYPLVY